MTTSSTKKISEKSKILPFINPTNQLSHYKQIAYENNIEFADLLKNPPQASLTNPRLLQDYLELEAIPWRTDPDGTIIIATTHQKRIHHRWAAVHFPNYRLVQTTPRDIQRSIATIFGAELSSHSIGKLAETHPHRSAKKLLDKLQYWIFALLLLTLLVAISQAPSIIISAFLVSITLFHLLTLGLKSYLFSTGGKRREELWNYDRKYPQLTEDQLPTYSLLIPLFKEAVILPQLIAALRSLNYPAHKLDIKLIIESDDQQTLAAAIALKPEVHFDIVTVPHSHPRTKPKACNYALQFAKGDIVTIYDAEDQPPRDQLRRVAHRFAYGAYDLVCVQCRLNYYNYNKNLLTRLFALEYCSWFDFMIPGLQALQLPIPLGGTSNHISRKKLVEMGEWDPFNVTEDADLGIRFSALNYRVETVSSLTKEQAPSQIWPWIKQRSRWIKGYMQTWIVNMRHPIQLLRNLGFRGFVGFQLFIGGPCLVFLTTPLLIGCSIYWLVNPPLWDNSLAKLVLPLSIAALCYGITIHWLFSLIAAQSQGWSSLKVKIAILCFPLYWLLHSVASFRALYQLLTRPHYWDKTEHSAEN